MSVLPSDFRKAQALFQGAGVEPVVHLPKDYDEAGVFDSEHDGEFFLGYARDLSEWGIFNDGARYLDFTRPPTSQEIAVLRRLLLSIPVSALQEVLPVGLQVPCEDVIKLISPLEQDRASRESDDQDLPLNESIDDLRREAEASVNAVLAAGWKGPTWDMIKDLPVDERGFIMYTGNVGWGALRLKTDLTKWNEGPHQDVVNVATHLVPALRGIQAGWSTSSGALYRIAPLIPTLVTIAPAVQFALAHGYRARLMDDAPRAPYFRVYWAGTDFDVGSTMLVTVPGHSTHPKAVLVDSWWQETPDSEVPAHRIAEIIRGISALPDVVERIDAAFKACNGSFWLDDVLKNLLTDAGHREADDDAHELTEGKRENLPLTPKQIANIPTAVALLKAHGCGDVTPDLDDHFVRGRRDETTSRWVLVDLATGEVLVEEGMMPIRPEDIPSHL